MADVCVHVFVETFQMGKIHKDIAMFMVDAAKNEEYNDQKLVKVNVIMNLAFYIKNWERKYFFRRNNYFGGTVDSGSSSHKRVFSTYLKYSHYLSV